MSIKVFLPIALVAVILISGCAQQEKKTVKSQEPVAPLPPSDSSYQSPSPIQVGAAGDVIGSELVKSDIIANEISDPDIAQLDSGLAEVESGL